MFNNQKRKKENSIENVIKILQQQKKLNNHCHKKTITETDGLTYGQRDGQINWFIMSMMIVVIKQKNNSWSVFCCSLFWKLKIKKQLKK